MGGCPNKPRRSRPIRSSLGDLSGLSAAILKNDSPWLIRGSPQRRTNVFGEARKRKTTTGVCRAERDSVHHLPIAIVVPRPRMPMPLPITIGSSCLRRATVWLAEAVAGRGPVWPVIALALREACRGAGQHQRQHHDQFVRGHHPPPFVVIKTTHAQTFRCGSAPRQRWKISVIRHCPFELGNGSL
jgi:hypothetical protein